MPTNRFDMTGQWVWITGGLGNIGRELATGAAECGANICFLDMIEADEDFLTQLQTKHGIKTHSATLDLSNQNHIEEVFHEVLADVGAIDTLINNAAFVGTTDLQGWAVSFESQGTEAWRAALEVNLTAPFILSQTATPHLKASTNGSILNIGSIYGIIGPDLRLYEETGMGNPAAYAASKGGLTQLTRWLATVLAPDIRVNCISPGGISRHQDPKFVTAYVERTPLRRMGVEADIVGAALLLSSQAGAYITGQNIVVDGGYSVW